MRRVAQSRIGLRKHRPILLGQYGRASSSLDAGTAATELKFEAPCHSAQNTRSKDARFNGVADPTISSGCGSAW